MVDTPAERAEIPRQARQFAARARAGLEGLSATHVVSAACMAFLLIVVTIYGLTLPLNIDEHQYISAAYLIGDSRIT
ncbi:MAG: hypothetical protein AAGL49_14000 [Pseudomonadota bacterium]